MKAALYKVNYHTNVGLAKRTYVVPLEHRCVRCGLDLRLDPRAGCICDRYHDNSFRKVPARTTDYEPWDGYSWYEVAKMVKDEETE